MLREGRLRLDADPKRRGVGGPKRRVFGLEVLELAKESVVFLVRDRGAIEHVVLVVGALDLLAERCGPRRQRGIDRCHRRLGGGGRAHPLASSSNTCIATATSRSSSSSDALGNRASAAD